MKELLRVVRYAKSVTVLMRESLKHSLNHLDISKTLIHAGTKCHLLMWLNFEVFLLVEMLLNYVIHVILV